MNRRVLIAVVLALPLAGLGWATKVAASWRPMKIAGTGTVAAIEVTANERYIVVGGPDSVFDLRTGTTRALNGLEGVALGDFGWRLDDRKGLLLRHGDNAAIAYAAPKFMTNYMTVNGQRVRVEPNVNAGIVVRVSPAANRVEMVGGHRYYRWNQTTRRLERNVELDDLYGDTQALSRDGEAVVDVANDRILRNSTRTDGQAVVVPLGVPSAYRWQQISPQSSYVLCDDLRMQNLKGILVWRIVDAQNGREIWNFDAPPSPGVAVFSPDETLIAAPFANRKIWEIRRLSNGELLRTLPLASGVTAGAFSPDNLTLYSAARGALYRQRAQ